MNNSQSSLFCALGGWGLAIIAGLLGAVLLMVLGDWRLIQAIFAAIVITILLGALMYWVVCRPLPVPEHQRAAMSAPHPVQSSKQSAKAAVAAAQSGAEPEPATPATAAVAAAKAGVVPSAALAGEAELAARKGAWKYEAPASDAKAKGASAKAQSAKPAEAAASAATDSSAKAAAATSASASADSSAKPAQAKSQPASSAGNTDKDYDGDGVTEGKDEGKRPSALDGPRDGTADNLKEIKGIGPKLEKLCNSMGFYHFDQIAEWTSDEIAWVDANLEGFKGRVTRDEWVAQAKILAAGGETEFSKRVDKGGVY